MKVGDFVRARESEKCYLSEMWQDLGGLGSVGVNSGAHQVDQFGTTGKIFIDQFSEHIPRLESAERKPTYIESFSTIGAHALSFSHLRLPYTQYTEYTHGHA